MKSPKAQFRKPSGNLVTSTRTFLTRSKLAAFNNGENAPDSEEQAQGTQNGAKKPLAEKGRIKISSQEEAEAILSELRGAIYTVLKVEEKEQRRQPYAPYTTSTMQQDASVRLY